MSLLLLLKAPPSGGGGTTPQFESAGTYGTTNSPGTSFTVGIPSGVVNGSIVTISGFTNTGVTVTCPGFSHAPDSPQQGLNNQGFMLWKRATGAEGPGTYTVSLSATEYGEGQAHRYSGCISTGSPWDDTDGAFNNTNAGTSPGVQVTTTGPNRLLVHACTSWAGGDTWTPENSPAFINRTTGNYGLPPYGLSNVFTYLQAAAGASGVIQATVNSSDKMTAWLGALKGNPGGGTTEVTQSWDLRWQVRNNVTQSYDIRWLVRNNVTQSYDLRWLVRNEVTASYDLRWLVRNAVQQSYDLRWLVRNEVSQSYDLRWLVWSNVTQSYDLRWLVRNNVQQSYDLRWQVRNEVAAQTYDLRWLVRQQVQQSYDLRWLVREQVQNSWDLRWLVRNQVQQSYDLRWLVRQNVTQSYDLRWVVDSSITQVTQSWDLRWLVRQNVQQAYDLRWRVSNDVQQTWDLRWLVRNQVAGQWDLRWQVRNEVTRQWDLRWLVRAQVMNQYQLLWVVESAPFSPVPLPAQVSAYLSEHIGVTLEELVAASLTETVPEAYPQAE